MSRGRKAAEREVRSHLASLRAQRAADTRARRREALDAVLAKPRFETAFDVSNFIHGLSPKQQSWLLFLLFFTYGSARSPQDWFRLAVNPRGAARPAADGEGSHG